MSSQRNDYFTSLRLGEMKAFQMSGYLIKAVFRTSHSPLSFWRNLQAAGEVVGAAPEQQRHIC